MEKSFKNHLEGTTLTIHLGVELAKENAPDLLQLLGGYRGQDIRKIVFDATELVFVSSAGIRCVIYARQELGKKPEIVFENCAKEIHEAFHMTGLDRFISFVEDERNVFGKDNKEANAGSKVHQKLAEIKQQELDDFAANNDVVCYQMKLGEE